jgi:hypothetical protein
METTRAWVAAARFEQAVLAPVCVAIGSSYAHFDAQQGPGLPAHVIVTLGAFAAGVGVNLVDHAWERMQAPPPDPKNPIPEYLRPLDARDAAIGGGAAIALAAVCGLALVPLSGAATAGYGALAVLLLVVRGVPAVGLDALGWSLSEIAAILALGPLATLAGFASQAGAGSWGAFLAGLPAGLVAATPSIARRFSESEIGKELRQALLALPLLATAAVMLAVRGGEYGPLAFAATLPMLLAAAAGWRLPAAPGEADQRLWTKLATGCAIVALLVIVMALRMATSE